MSCSSDDGGTDKALDQFLDEGRRVELEQAIGDRVTNLISEQNLLYVMSLEPNFSEATQEDVSGTGLPAGTWLEIGFDLPAPTAKHPAGPELQVYGPLELYAEAVRPFIDEMDFVDMYFLPWQNSGGSAFLIYPEHMRLFLDGDITVEELSKKISIYGP